MTDAGLPPQPTQSPPRRRWVRPRVTTQGAHGGQVLLCASNTPYSCFGGACCDIHPSCGYLCSGQGG